MMEAVHHYEGTELAVSAALPARVEPRSGAYARRSGSKREMFAVSACHSVGARGRRRLPLPGTSPGRINAVESIERSVSMRAVGLTRYLPISDP
ncbi:MAG: hypothetical protein Q8S13_02920, partial [Dehalococcoidia bacterium]|nr:hypothetical protein [Dehalococcoidia bacterium]